MYVWYTPYSCESVVGCPSDRPATSLAVTAGCFCQWHCGIRDSSQLDLSALATQSLRIGYFTQLAIRRIKQSKRGLGFRSSKPSVAGGIAIGTSSKARGRLLRRREGAGFVVL